MTYSFSLPRITSAFLLLFGGLFFAGSRLTAAGIESDGTLDFSFNAGNFTNGQVLAAALQSDGKLLIGGQFSKVHGVTRLGLARINADGSLDSTFVPPAGTDVNAQQIVVQPDGKIIVTSTLSGTIGIVRLNSDG